VHIYAIYNNNHITSSKRFTIFNVKAHCSLAVMRTSYVRGKSDFMCRS
jgi:hypothetical protein